MEDRCMLFLTGMQPITHHKWPLFQAKKGLSLPELHLILISSHRRNIVQLLVTMAHPIVPSTTSTHAWRRLSYADGWTSISLGMIGTCNSLWRTIVYHHDVGKLVHDMTAWKLSWQTYPPDLPHTVKLRTAWLLECLNDTLRIIHYYCHRHEHLQKLSL